MKMKQLDAFQALQRQLEEHFDPGAPVEMFLSLERTLTSAEVRTVLEHLRAGGVNAEGDTGTMQDPASGETWPHVLRLSFARPTRRDSQAEFIPFAILLIGALGAVGIASFFAVRIGDQVSNIFKSIANNIIPLALVAGGVFVLYSMTSRKKA